jgi:hypothetical protein
LLVDVWIISLFAVLFGACAVINYRLGVSKGVEGTLNVLIDQKIIKVNGDIVSPYIREE